MQKNHLFTLTGILLLLTLILTRFVHLGWGLPLPFHPDERNMAVALQQLSCPSFNTECFNPHFFAYGQFPLYLGFIFIKITSFFNGTLRMPIDFVQAVLSLRFISAVSSVFTAILLYKIAGLIIEHFKISKNEWLVYAVSTIFIFSPGLIQLAHFGTTESLLMLFFTALVYVCILYHNKKINDLHAVLIFSLILGLAAATKVSAMVFFFLPLYVILKRTLHYRDPIHHTIPLIVGLILGSTIVGLIASPYNLLAWSDFYNSIKYESQVGLGQVKVFYTRQFEGSLPGIFQLKNIFPYVFGLPVMILSLIGFFLLPWKKDLSVLRMAIVSYLVFNVGLYAKWTRFIAPIFPLLLVFATVYIVQIYELLKKVPSTIKNSLIFLVIFLCILPGIAYLSVYLREDVRLTASRWLQENIPANSKVLQESGNVVDLPISPENILVNNNVDYKNLNFYELDNDPFLKYDLSNSLSLADYIIVPSRRVFANHTCVHLKSKQSSVISGYIRKRCQELARVYPQLNSFYEDLFTGKLGFTKVAEFDSYPSISIFNKKIFSLSDEMAEETWSVFDHPVIRIYKRN